MQRHLKVLTAFVLMLSLTACGGDDSPESENSSAPEGAISSNTSSGENPFLAYVDANTAYLYANLDKLPDAIVDAAWAMNDATSASNMQMMQGLEQDEDVPEQVKALMGELMNLLTREGWENAGFSANPKYAIHAVSVFPFGHMELVDGVAFSQLIARVEAELEEPLQQRDVDGELVYWFELEQGLGIALHQTDSMASAALIPDQAEYLARLTGQAQPADPMDGDQLEDFNRSLAFTPHGSGFFDWQRMMSELRSPDSFLLALDDSGAFKTFSENPACIVEIDALTAAMPRMVYGYTDLDEDTMDFLVRQETSASLGNALALIAQAPVSIDQPLNGMFNFGMAFDLIKAREFAQGLVNGWMENPPQCPLFEGIAAGAPAMQTNLNRPIPPMITNLQGMYIEAMDFNMAEGFQPDFEGTVSFFMNNPQLLVGMAQMFSPAAAAIQLSPGSEPQPVPMDALPPQFQGLDIQAWMGMGDNAIGLAIGEAQLGALEQRLKTSDADPYIMAGKMDFSILTRFMDIASQTLGQDEEELQGMLDVQRQQYEAIANFYEQGSFTVGLTEKGIDMFFGTELK